MFVFHAIASRIMPAVHRDFLAGKVLTSALHGDHKARDKATHLLMSLHHDEITTSSVASVMQHTVSPFAGDGVRYAFQVASLALNAHDKLSGPDSNYVPEARALAALADSAVATAQKYVDLGLGDANEVHDLLMEYANRPDVNRHVRQLAFTKLQVI